MYLIVQQLVNQLLKYTLQLYKTIVQSYKMIFKTVYLYFYKFHVIIKIRKIEGGAGSMHLQQNISH